MGKHKSGAIKADKRRREHAADGKVQRRARPCTKSPSQNNIFDGRTPAERQAASSLAQFARSDAGSQLSGDQVEQLISTLIVSLCFPHHFTPLRSVANLGIFVIQTHAPSSIGIPDLCTHTHDYQSNGNPPPAAPDVKTREVNGGSSAMSTRAKATASNNAAYAVNHANTIQTAPDPSVLPQSLTAQEELAELLKLDATLQAKIAAIRAATITPAAV